MSQEFLSALDALTSERKIDRNALLSAIEAALITAYKRNYNASNVNVHIDSVTGDVHVYANKRIVEVVTDSNTEISLEAAKQIQPQYEVGGILDIEVTPRKFGRIAAQTAKQVVVQKIREAERGNIFNEYSEKENEISEWYEILRNMHAFPTPIFGDQCRSKIEGKSQHHYQK